jgi:hypothetical protein
MFLAYKSIYYIKNLMYVTAVKEKEMQGKKGHVKK